MARLIQRWLKRENGLRIRCEVCYNPRGQVAGAAAARSAGETTDTALSQYLSEPGARLSDDK